MSEQETLKKYKEETLGQMEQAFPQDMSEKERSVVQAHWERFVDLKTERNKKFRAFNNRTPIEYWDDSTERWYSHIEPSEDDDESMANIFSPVTRNKCIGIFAKLSGTTPGVMLKKRGDEDLLASTISTDIYGSVEDMTDADMTMFYAMLEAGIKGTVFVYEGFTTQWKKERTIDMESPYFENESGELRIKEDYVRESNFVSEIIPLDEAYPGNIYKRTVKEMPDFYWRQVMSYKQFKKLFYKFPGFDKVKKAGDISQEAVFKEYMTQGLGEDQIEVIRAFDKDNDSFVIIANGRWLNPLPGEQVSPMPWDHGEIPIWSAIYEPLSTHFIYGKSIPDKLKGEQDSINLILNMLINQTMYSIWKPILSSDTEDIAGDFFTPAKVTPVGDINAYKELEVSQPSIAAYKMLDMLYAGTERNTISDNQSSGTLETGVTATATERGAQTAGQLLGMFQKFLLQAAKDKARLRFSNILQFHVDPSMIDEMYGKGKGDKWKEVYQSYRNENVRRIYGKPGRTTRIIKLVKQYSDIPSPEVVQKEATSKNAEIFYITPDYIRHFEYDIKIDKRSIDLRSKSMQKAEEIEFQATVAKFYPNRLGDNTFADLAEAYDRDPTHYPKAPNTGPVSAEGSPEGGLGGPGAGTNGENRFNGGDLASQRLEATRKQARSLSAIL